MVSVNAHKNGAGSRRCARGRCCFYRQQIYVLYWSKHKLLQFYFFITGDFYPFARLLCEGAAPCPTSLNQDVDSRRSRRHDSELSASLSTWVVQPTARAWARTPSYTEVSAVTAEERTSAMRLGVKVIAPIFRAEIPVESPPLEASLSVHSKKCAYVTFEAYRIYRHMRAAVILLYSALRTTHRSVSRLLVLMVHSALGPTRLNEFNKWFP